MVEETYQSGYGRLEDFIAFAKAGSIITATVKLTKELVSKKIHPGDHQESKDEISMQIFLGTFIFQIGDEKRSVSKVYMISSAEETADEAKIDAHIANERLKSDYKRLKAVNIKFKENFF